MEGFVYIFVQEWTKIEVATSALFAATPHRGVAIGLFKSRQSQKGSPLLG